MIFFNRKAGNEMNLPFILIHQEGRTHLDTEALYMTDIWKG